ncbi:hypothetical protein BDV93DRAFT_610113 [Ceratobasidium sp. AG-I]|nr:hypothetical protein BDV93DRAFT_610113 [Ceratobasidium sp. AG-I]
MLCAHSYRNNLHSPLCSSMPTRAPTNHAVLLLEFTPLGSNTPGDSISESIRPGCACSVVTRPTEGRDNRGYNGTRERGHGKESGRDQGWKPAVHSKDAMKGTRHRSGNQLKASQAGIRLNATRMQPRAPDSD